MNACIVRDQLAWEVLLPGKRQTHAWGLKPRATLVINGGTEHEERMVLPKTVATLLLSKQKAGEVHPSSRNELIVLVEGLLQSCARTRVERLIDRREYTTTEIARKLAEDGYAQDVIEPCIRWASQIGLISNDRFADAFIHTKVNAGWGMGRIARELAQRGIKVDELRGWPYDYLDPESELDRAVELASRRMVSGARAYPKLVQYLCGRGYTTGVAMQAARCVLDDAEECDLVDF